MKNRKKFVLALLAGCLTVTAVCGIKHFDKKIDFVSVAAETLENKNGGLNTKYTYGTELTIPKNTILWEGKEYETEIFVTFPDGRTYAENEIVLNQTGVYKVEYRALAGKYYVYTNVSFHVENSLYTLENENSSVYYGKHSQYPNVQTGAVVQIAKGDTFQFNGLIDFNDREKSDAFVSWVYTPNTIGSEDVSRLVIRLTDAYDENNYVEIFCKQSPEDFNRKGACYWTAGSADQSQIGLSWRTPGYAGGYLSPLDGNTYKIYENSQWGMGWDWSMTGTPKNGTMEEQVLSLSLDYNTKAVYINGKLINDLDDTGFIKNPWQGFTNGQAYLSVYSNHYSAASCGLVFTDIGGYDLSMASYPDTESPELTVDYGGYDEDDLPIADINKGYKVFDAQAYDLVDGKIDVAKSVWYNYGGKNAVRYAVKDGKFVPDLEGIYSIVYKATDRSGNVTEKLVRIQAKHLDRMECNLEGLTSEGVAGTEFQLFDSIDFNNTTGNVSVKLSAVPESDSGYRYEVNEETYRFRPLHAGEYVLYVETSDYVSTEIFTYNFSVRSSNTSVFEEYEVNLPAFLLKGVTYSVPTLPAVKLDSGMPVAVEAAISVVEADGEVYKITNGEYTPKTTGKAIYSYDLKNGETVTKEVSVVDGKYEEGKVDSLAYFQATKGRIEKALTTDYLEVKTDVFKAKDGIVEFEFINRLRYDIFVMSIGANKDSLNFESFNLLLNGEIKLTYTKNNDGTLSFIINDTEVHNTNLIFDEYMQAFEVNYNNATRTIKLNSDSDKSWTIGKKLNGEIFEGFSVKGIYAQFSMEGISGQSAIHIYSIDSNPFYEEDYDLLAPDVLFEREGGDYNIGETILIKPAYGFDMFSPSVAVWVKVVAPDGTLVQIGQSGSGNEVLADQSYSFEARQYGKYVISYSVTDLYGNTASFSYNINVIDSDPPMVKILNPVTTTTGNTFVIADLEISDNLSETCVVYVNVTAPDGSLHKVAIGETFTASVKGTYTVTYCVFDEEKNMTMVRYRVEVR